MKERWYAMRCRRKQLWSRKIFSIALAFMLLLSSGNVPAAAAEMNQTGEETVTATETDAEIDVEADAEIDTENDTEAVVTAASDSDKTGYEEFECIELSNEEAEAFSDSPDALSEIPHVYSINWDQYGNDYCYNNMTATEKRYYDRLNEVCSEFANSTVDAGYNSSLDMYYMTGVSYEGLTYSRAKELTYIFVYQNPQYYFTDTRLAYNDNMDIIWLSCYDDFSNGVIRSVVTEMIYEKVDSWIDEIQDQATVYEQEKKAHDIVCANIEYVEGTFDQSAYSAIIEGESVCAGYSKMFSILMNGSGIDTVAVTGSNHAWNKVNLDGTWYNVDTTWDDFDEYIDYSFFNKSDSTIYSGHVQHTWYDGIAPVASLDYGTTPYTEQVIYVSSVTLNRDILKLVMDETESAQLTETLLPVDATDYAVVWSSSDEDVATVSQSGVVTAYEPGKADIKVTSNNLGRQDVCQVKVYGVYSAPQAPVVAGKTSSSVTLKAMDGCSYSKDGVNWQTSTTFYNLKPNTTYTFYAKRNATTYGTESPKSPGTTVKTDAINVTVSASGIYLAEHTNKVIYAGLVAEASGTADLEYRWLVCDTSKSPETWTEIQGWTKNNEWLTWYPEKTGDYVIVGQVRVVGNEDCVAESSIGIPHHAQIKGKCQMPYTGPGGGYLIGVETYDNPSQSYRYELLVLDCTLLAQGKDAWIWSTGQCKVPEKSFWAVWQPQYGYYWTLFRVYDADGNLIDEECFPFVNAY